MIYKNCFYTAPGCTLLVQVLKVSYYDKYVVLKYNLVYKNMQACDINLRAKVTKDKLSHWKRYVVNN